MDVFTFVTELTGKLDGAGYSDVKWHTNQEHTIIRVRDNELTYKLMIPNIEINYSVADLSEYYANKIIKAFADKEAEQAVMR